MRPAVLNDPRTRNLMGRLHGDFIKAIGLLELVWHFAADHAVDGLLTLSAVDELSRHLIWPNDPPSLLELLSDSGWAIRGESGLLLSDWTENRPAHLVERMRKRQNRPVSRDTGLIEALVPGQTSDVPGQEAEVMADVPGQEEIKGKRGVGGFLRTEEKRALADTQKAKPSPGDLFNEMEAKTPAAPALASAFADLKALWNRAPGVVPCRGPNADRLKKLSARLKEDSFRDNWQEALTKFPLPMFDRPPRGDGTKDWIPHIDWFLRPGIVLQIVEGKYDAVIHQTGGSNGKSTVRPGQQFDPHATCDFETAFD